MQPNFYGRDRDGFVVKGFYSLSQMQRDAEKSDQNDRYLPNQTTVSVEFDKLPQWNLQHVTEEGENCDEQDENYFADMVTFDNKMTLYFWPGVYVKDALNDDMENYFG